MKEKRRLAAILSADMVGYSRLMEVDESGTIARQKSVRNELIDPEIIAHGGRIVKTTGDGILVEFPSIIEAVKFSTKLQRAMVVREEKTPENKRIQYRIGINLGDIVIDGDDILGDGVNIAARLESMAVPGGICISQNVFNQVKNRLEFGYEELGPVKVKNLSEPVVAFRIHFDPKVAGNIIRSEHPALISTPLVMGVAAFLVVFAVASLMWWLQPWVGNTGPSSTTERQIFQSDKPVIAVLPFDNLSNDPQQDYFSDGITDDLITDLSKISGLYVIARNTTFTYKGTPTKAQKIAQEVGASHVLEGSVRKEGNRIRINAQLIDAKSGHYLWADRFDRQINDVFALQDEVTTKIVTALSVKLEFNERIELSSSVQAHPEAYDILLQGLERYRRFTWEGILESREYFERAISLDPNFARAYADLALSYAMPVQLGIIDKSEDSIRKALQIANHAAELDDAIPQVHFAFSIIYRLMKRHDDSISAARRAISIEPNYADGYGLLAMSLNFAGMPEEGLASINQAMKLNPRHPFFYVFILGQSYYLLNRFKEAAEQFELAKSKNPQFSNAHKMLAATYSALGRIEDAEWAIAELETLNPEISLVQEEASSPYKDESIFRLYIERLRKAGLQ